MTADALDLARRAVACPGWRWLPGMRGIDQSDGQPWTCIGRVSPLHGEEPHRVLYRWAEPGGAISRDTAADVLPDLTDPATLGCLLALVREAWGDRGDAGTVSVYAMRHPTASSLGVDEPWAVYVSPPIVSGVSLTGPTEAAALVAALEAAP